MRSAAAEQIEGLLRTAPSILDVGDDNTQGRMELKLRLNPDAIVRADVNPEDVTRVVRLYTDGEAVASMQHQGERRAGGPLSTRARVAAVGPTAISERPWRPYGRLSIEPKPLACETVVARP